MQLPPFTSQEANGFDTISDFLYPNNNPDPEAIGMFLDGFLMDQKRSQYYHPPAEQAQTMGYLLKALDPAEFSQWGRAFERFYLVWRASHEDYFHSWFDSANPVQKEAAKTCMLSMLAGAPPVALRVSLMMDGMEHYPEMTVQAFIGKSLLRIKPPAFAKALRPRLPQMPLMLKMAKDLRTAAPEYSELADAIVMAVFVERMNQKPAPASTQRSKTAVEAFLLLMDENIELDTDACIRVAKSRFKDKNLLADMLCFPTWALAQGTSHNWLMRTPSKKEKDMAVKMLPILVQDLLSVRTKASVEYDNTLIAAHRYLAAHPPEDDASREQHSLFHTQMVQWFSTKTTVGMEAFLYTLDHLLPSTEHEKYWAAWMTHHNEKSFQALARREINGHSVARYGVSQKTVEEYRRRVIDRISPQELTAELYLYAKTLFSKTKADYPDRYSRDPIEKEKRSTQDMLREMVSGFRHLSHFTTAALRDDNGFKQLVSACAMTYLYQGANTPYAVYEPMAGEFLNLSSEPLPMLRTLYPEHTGAINTLRKELVRNIQASSSSTKKIDYYGMLYKTLGTALYEKNVLDASVMGQLVDSMELSVFDYFAAMQVQQEVSFDVPEDVFANLSI